MPMLEKLEKKGVHTFDKAAREIRAMTEELYFYTPKNRITVTGLFHSPEDRYVLCGINKRVR